MQKINFRRNHKLGHTTIDCEHEYLGNIGDLNVFKYSNYLIRVTKPGIGKEKIAAEISYTKRKNRVKIGLTRVDIKFSGLNLAPRLYKFIMQHWGVIIQAGDCQSPGGRRLWCILAGMPDVTVYTVVNNRAILLEPDIDFQEISHYDIDDLYLTKYKVFACLHQQ